MMRFASQAAFQGILLTQLLIAAATGQPTAPLYEECRLDSVFPNGGRRGTTVSVEFRGTGQGLASPRDIVIDGPPGIRVKELVSRKGDTVTASLEIAADAPLGRRWLRVLNERSGLTNFAYFIVGDLAELIEKEPNEELTRAQPVEVEQAVINGRINPPGDVDCFRIRGRAGQKLVAAIAAHALDVHGQKKDYGIADFSLELLNAAGQTLATAEDSIGFDPLIEHTLPADGDYLLRVQLLNYGGYPEAVYRLAVGDAPYVVGAFPPGLQAGTQAEVEIFGPNVLKGAKQRLTVPAREPAQSFAEDFPLRHVTLQDVPQAGLDVPLVVGSLPESIEAEPNNEFAQASPVALPATVSGRFNEANDSDWYRVELATKQQIWLETNAHRFLRSPVDTLIQIYDSGGKLLGENDDENFDPGYESFHDFKTTDSGFVFKAPSTGSYFVKVTDQGGVYGKRAIYRLTIKPAEADFRVTHFPDAVPVWGPGSTACVLVRVDRFGGCDEDVELSVEGLPPGWTTTSATSLGGKGVRSNSPYQLKLFLSITAPGNAQLGTCFPFRIVGRSRKQDQSIERTSLPLSLFYTSDTGFFRLSPVSRVAVAKPQGPWLEAIEREFTATAGGSIAVPVRVVNAGPLKAMPLVVNLATAGVACALSPPQTLAIQDGVVTVQVKVPPQVQPGTYGIIIAQSWRSDIRIGMPGPCTPLIKLTVTPPKQ